MYFSSVYRVNYITPRRAGLSATAGLSCSKEDKILIKNLQQLTGYTATRFLRVQNQKLVKSTNSDNSETNCYTNLWFC